MTIIICPKVKCGGDGTAETVAVHGMQLIVTRCILRGEPVVCLLGWRTPDPLVTLIMVRKYNLLPYLHRTGAGKTRTWRRFLEDDTGVKSKQGITAPQRPHYAGGKDDCVLRKGVREPR